MVKSAHHNFQKPTMQYSIVSFAQLTIQNTLYKTFYVLLSVARTAM